jgi:hypothetical protein
MILMKSTSGKTLQDASASELAETTVVSSFSGKAERSLHQLQEMLRDPDQGIQSTSMPSAVSFANL